LQEHFRIPQISTGDILRAAVKDGTALGRQAKEYMDRGELVPDAVIIDIVEERLSAPDCRDGFLLDGFPRTVAQAEALEGMLARRHLALDGAISLKVPRKELVKRLSGRRTCRQCHTMYHIRFNPPKKDLVCDNCGGELYQRDDDREETIEARMEVYDRESAPLHEHFRDLGVLYEVDGAKTTDQVFQQILRKLGKAA
jgi:adenylate kinase